MITFNDVPTLLESLINEVRGLKSEVERLGNKKESEIIPSIEALAKRLGRSKQCIMDWKKRGVIPYHQSGRTVYFKSDEIDDALKSR